MTKALVHRGPDDEGHLVNHQTGVALGHRRLSIIDLSPNGHQPMSNVQNTCSIVFNGEIYNYRELRSELTNCGRRFISNCDTEVLLQAYEEWGDRHVDRLRGMFSYVIFDARPRETRRSRSPFRMFAARDRLGIKPFYYYWHGGTFVFASELKAIKCLEGLDLDLDRKAIFDYLTYLYIPTPKSAYTRIAKLPPGHTAVLDGGDLVVEKYWDVPHDSGAGGPTSFDQAREMVAWRLKDAVRAHLVADVPVGVFLSGGMDSSAVTALASAHVSEPLNTFSIGFDSPGYSETEHAGLVARVHRTLHHEETVSRDDLRMMLERVVSMYDEPYADGSAVPTFRVSELARRQVKVALSGDGGDEVFAGYKWYSRWLERRSFPISPRLRQKLGNLVDGHWYRRGRTLMRGGFADDVARYGQLMELYSPQEKRQVLGAELLSEVRDRDDYWYFRSFWDPSLEPLKRMQYLDLKTYLPDDILTKVDRASMSVSLEVRPPLIDHLLVEEVFALPSSYLQRSGGQKSLLRLAMGDALPTSIAERPKQGFSAPWFDWMREEPAWVGSYLDSGVAMQSGILSPDWRAGLQLDQGTKLWSLLVLEEWLRQDLA